MSRGGEGRRTPAVSLLIHVSPLHDKKSTSSCAETCQLARSLLIHPPASARDIGSACWILNNAFGNACGHRLGLRFSMAAPAPASTVNMQRLQQLRRSALPTPRQPQPQAHPQRHHVQAPQQPGIPPSSNAQPLQQQHAEQSRQTQAHQPAQLRTQMRSRCMKPAPRQLAPAQQSGAVQAVLQQAPAARQDGVPCPPPPPPQQVQPQQQQPPPDDSGATGLEDLFEDLELVDYTPFAAAAPAAAAGAGTPGSHGRTDAAAASGDRSTTGAVAAAQHTVGGGSLPATELIFRFERRGEGWGEEILPHLVMENRPLEKPRRDRPRSNQPDPWEVGSASSVGSVLPCSS